MMQGGGWKVEVGGWAEWGSGSRTKHVWSDILLMHTEELLDSLRLHGQDIAVAHFRIFLYPLLIPGESYNDLLVSSSMHSTWSNYNFFLSHID
jgi:hypothetical protein